MIAPDTNATLCLESETTDAVISLGAHEYSYYARINGVRYGDSHINFTPESFLELMQKIGWIQKYHHPHLEPRDTHTKSHAGIFTRFQNANIKKGQLLKAGPIGEEISADTILLEVRKELQGLSLVEECKLID